MDPTALRFASALLHSVPNGRLRLVHDTGLTSSIAYDEGACLSPCDWRHLLAAATNGTLDEEVRSYPERIVGFRFDRGFEPMGSVARRIEQNRVEYWFASTLHPDWLADVFAEHEIRVPPSLVDSHIFGDTELRVSVAMLREVAPCVRPHLYPLADALASAAAVTELLGEGVWIDTSR